MPFNPNNPLWKETDYMYELLGRANQLPDPENAARQLSMNERFTPIFQAFIDNCRSSKTDEITQELDQAQKAVYRKLIEKAVTVEDVYRLMKVSDAFDSGYQLMQMAAARGHLFSIRQVAGSILAGSIEPTELSIAWALQALSYIETEMAKAQTEEERNANSSIMDGFLRARTRVIGLGNYEEIPQVGTESYDLIRQHTLAERIKHPLPYAPTPFILLNELARLNLKLFDFISPPAAPGEPSASSIGSSQLVDCIDLTAVVETKAPSLGTKLTFFSPKPSCQSCKPEPSTTESNPYKMGSGLLFCAAATGAISIILTLLGVATGATFFLAAALATLVVGLAVSFIEDDDEEEEMTFSYR